MTLDTSSLFTDLDPFGDAAGFDPEAPIGEPASAEECGWVEPILAAIREQLAAGLDCPIELAATSVERRHSRPIGEGSIHISFKLGFRNPIHGLHGCLLMPFAEAISLAGRMMMLPREELEALRDAEALDPAQKDAMLEIGNVMASAAQEAAESIGLRAVRVRSEGCQGVRDGVRPALEYEEGAPLVVARVRLEVESFPPTEAILVLPNLADLAC